MTDSPASSLTHRACPFQHSYLRKNFILPSFPRKAKQAGPEMDRSKVGRTFRKRKASPSASCRRQILSLQCVWPRGPKFSGSEFVLKAHLNPESPGRQREGGGVCTDRAPGPEWQSAQRGRPGSRPCAPADSRELTASRMGINHLAVTPFRTQSSGRSLRSKQHSFPKASKGRP